MKWFAVTGLLIAAAAFTIACGGDDEETPSETGFGASLSGVVAPNTFLTFEGQRYRLTEVQQASLLPRDEFQERGIAEAADIDHTGDLKVFTRQDEADTIYTLSPATGSGEDATPETWLRWELES